MSALDELLSRACTEVLDSNDLSMLCGLAIQESLVETALLKLLQAGTAAGRVNLAEAKGLTASHQARKRTNAQIRVLRAVNIVESEQFIPGLPFDMTSHAMHRFADRYGELTAEDLKLEAQRSSPRRARTFKGTEQWVSPLGVTFVLRRDAGKKRPICVTILPKNHHLR